MYLKLILSLILQIEIMTLVSAQWIYKTDLHRTTKRTAIGEWDDHIFLLGGSVSPKQVVKFDIATNNVNDFGENALNDTLFAYAGYENVNWAQISNLLYVTKRISNDISPNIYVFDLSRDDFSIPSIINTPVPINTQRACLAAKDEYPYLYRTGGYDPDTSDYTTHLQVYDIENNEWLVNMPSMQVARRNHACSIDNNGYLYVIGGSSTDDGTIASIERVQISSIDDLKDKSVIWHYIEALPTARSGPVSVYCDAYIYSLGGGDATTHLKQVVTIDTNTLDVSVLSDTMPYSATWGSAICVDCSIYVFGGYAQGTPSLGYQTWQKYDIPGCTTDEPTPTPTLSPVATNNGSDACTESLAELCASGESSITIPTYDISITCTERVPTAAPTFEPCTNIEVKFNINFILDESGSVNQNNYQNMIDFVQDLILYDINTISKVSALAYSRENDPIYYFMNDQSNRDGIISALEDERLDYIGDTTDTYNAIARGIDMFSEDGIIQVPDQNFMFLLTDGVPTCKSGDTFDPDCKEQLCISSSVASLDGQQLITELNERNIRLYILGIGNFDQTEIGCLTNNEYIYQIEDFTSEEFKLIEAEFRNILCPDSNQ